MASGSFPFQVVISGNELAAIQAILNQATEAKKRAEGILRNIEVEYQTLRNSPIVHDADAERRFHSLYWQRHALHLFVEQQTPVIEHLYSLTNYVWTPKELLEDEQRESSELDDGVSVDHASAA